MFEYGHWVSEVERPESSKAFVYIIKLDIDGVEKLYIGYKTIRGNRWMGYKTSSKVVKPLWENVVEAKIVEWFDNETDAEDREIEMLKAVNAAKNELYLNQHIPGEKFHCTGTKHSAQRKAARKSNPKCINASLLQLERIKSDEDLIKKHREAASITMTNLNNNIEFRQKQQNALKILNNDPDFKRKQARAVKDRLSKKICDGSGNIYEVANDAALANDIKISTVYRRCRLKLYGWKYI